CHDIRAALEDDNSLPLALVDDNVSSGIQSTAQLYAWCGIPRNQWPTECRAEDGIFEVPLGSPLVERLRKRKVCILVCVAQNKAIAKLRAAAKSLKFTDFDGVRFSHEIKEINWDPKLKRFLSDVGLSLIAWSRFGRLLADLTPFERSLCQK